MPSWKRTFYAAMVAQVCSITGFAFCLPFLPLYVRELGVPEASAPLWAGIASAAAALSMAVFSPIWGAVADRFGRKPMVVRAMFGGAVVLFLMSSVQNVAQLVACRVLQGMLTGTVTANIALVASVAPRERSGYALGLMQAAVFVGAAVGPFLGGEVAEAFGGMRPAFRVAAALLFAGAVVSYLFIEERFTPARREKGETRRAGFAAVVGAAGFLAAVVALFAVRFGHSVAAPVFPLFVEAVQGSSEGIYAVTGRIIALGGLAAAIAAWLLGNVSDAWGHRRVLIVSCLVAAGAAFGHVFAQRIIHLYLLRIGFGFAVAGMIPAANAIIRHTIQDKHLGKAYGVTNSVRAIGWACGPLAGGFLYDLVRVGMGKPAGLRAPFVLMGMTLVLTAWLVFARVQSTGPAPAEEATDDADAALTPSEDCV
jgi:DHA1 family multidrug resistance protein-like MFS transporter